MSLQPTVDPGLLDTDKHGAYYYLHLRNTLWLFISFLIIHIFFYLRTTAAAHKREGASC